MGGHVEAELHGVPFVPTFGVAVAGVGDSFYDNGMAVVLSTGPVNCNNVHVGIRVLIDETPPYPNGYHVISNLWGSEPGEYVCQDAECFRIVRSSTSDPDSSEAGHTAATTTITAVDQDVVTGSITFVAEGSRGPSDVDGTFEVKRCFP